MGGLGGLARMAGPAGAVVGGVAAVMGLIEKGGHEVQQLRNLGSIRGGAAGQGMGYEMQARMMALNPFITNEQSRQIIQSALTNGYTGTEFDTVTKFMTNNLTQMNMSVADSTQLLQTAATNSKSSVDDITSSLTHSMTTMKGMSGQGYNTLPERQESFKQSYSDLVASGVDPSVASQIAGQSTNDYANMPGMSQAGKEIQKGFSSNSALQYLMATTGGPGGGRIPGLDPKALGDPDRLPAALGGVGSEKYSQAKWNTIKRLAQMSNGNLTVFRRMLSHYGINMPIGEATKVLDNAGQINTGSKDDPAKAEREEQKEEDKRDRESDEEEEQFRANAGSPYGHWSVHTKDNHATTRETIRDKVSALYGGEAEVGDPDKKDDWQPFDPNDKEQMKNLRSGKFHIRQQGDTGKGKGLGELKPGDSSSGSGSGKGRDKPSGNAVHGHVTIQVQPAAMKDLLKIPSYVPLTSNEQQANAGYGTATKNNPPPGDTVTTRGAR